MPGIIERQNLHGDALVTPDLDSVLVADLTVDITQHRCPMTFVRTRLGLDRLVAGQVLAVLLTGDEPRRNVPATALEQGHAILARIEQPDGALKVLIRKG